MKITVNDETLEELPGLNIGLLYCQEINNLETNNDLDFLIKNMKKSLKNNFTKQELIRKIEHEKILNKPLLEKFVEEIYKKDSTLKNNISNICMYLSFQKFVPIFSIDVKNITNDIEIKISTQSSLDIKSGAEKININDYRVNKSTKNLIMLFASYNKKETKQILIELNQLVKRVCGGKNTGYLLNRNNKNKKIN